MTDIEKALTEQALRVKEGLGGKFDAGKPQYSLLDDQSILDLVRVLTLGAKKYAPGNWQKVENGDVRYYDALQRHLTAWRSGETSDPETGISHLAHAACNIMFLQWIERQALMREQS